jgi:hypothetical protein
MHCRIGGLSDGVERAPLMMVTRDELQYGEGAGAALFRDGGRQAELI